MLRRAEGVRLKDINITLMTDNKALSSPNRTTGDGSRELQEP